jgi:hypothetical protein
MNAACWKYLDHKFSEKAGKTCISDIKILFDPFVLQRSVVGVLSKLLIGTQGATKLNKMNRNCINYVMVREQKLPNAFDQSK